MNYSKLVLILGLTITHGLLYGQNETITELKKFATEGSITAQIELSKLYWDGYNGIEEDENISFDWMQKAANAGNPEAEYYLAQM